MPANLMVLLLGRRGVRVRVWGERATEAELVKAAQVAVRAAKVCLVGLSGGPAED